MKKKMNLVIIAFVMFALVLSACSNNSGSNAPSASNNAGESSDAAIDNSKEVKLSMYLLGEAPKGMPEVLAELNKKLKEDINATLDLNYIGWGEVQSKYPLVLASGEDVDIIFAADWNFYVQEAMKGAYYELNEELLKKYMPLHMAKLDPLALKAAEINGITYMVPTATPDRKASVALIRRDLREKYGIAEISKLSELGPYLEAIKKNEPDMIPLNLDSQFDLPTPFLYLTNEKLAYTQPLDSGNPMAQGIAYDYEDTSGKVFTTVEEPFLSAGKFAANIMKEWYDKGYVNKNPYANKTRSKDNFCEGLSGVAFGNSLDVASVTEQCAEKGIEVDILTALSPQGHAPQNTWLNNGLAVAANSDNPERALQAMDLIMQDPEYVYLTSFGIEGENYVITEDDKIGLPDGVTQENNTFPADSSGFWFVNKDLFKPMANWPQSYVDHRSSVGDKLKPLLYAGFTFNSENVKAQIANIANVSTQYGSPLFIGAVKNVDEAYNQLTEKLKAAGIEKVKADVEKQTQEYLKSIQ
ncbi:ABC transporter substrate-binding protein [Candidatus Pristimantibacillus sp. PTI5]|uniref:ABC transporter substrate-binding protein n=1 Tax=Candidatus Pristimantibacillus sp. PTI5 TaxID=3400422 RepID=UPI003B02677E